MLGTVQFGLPYGSVGSAQQVPRGEVREIVAAAHESGVRWVDTAPGYGSAESVLGYSLEEFPDLRVVTKLPRLSCLPPWSLKSPEALVAVIQESCDRLGREHLDVLLLHHAPDGSGDHRKLVHETFGLAKSVGLVGATGFSAYGEVDVRAAIADTQPSVVQVPGNVYDQRLARYGPELFGGGLTEVHVRSVFLQGVLLQPAASLPAYFSSIRDHQRRFHDECDRLGVTPQQAAIAYLAQLPFASRIVVGVASVNELAAAVQAVGEGPLPMDWEGFAINDDSIIDPRRWAIR